MEIVKIIKQSFLILKNNKVRTILTMIGIIIGIAAVVTVRSVGDGMKYKISEIANKSVENEILVACRENKNSINFNLFNDDDIREISILPGVKSVNYEKGETSDMSIGEVQFYENVKYLNNIVNDNILVRSNEDEKENLDNLFEEKSQIRILFGRNFEEKDINNDYVIISKYVAEMLHNDIAELINKPVKIGNMDFKIIGIFHDPMDYLNYKNLYIQKNSYDSYLKVKNNTNKNGEENLKLKIVIENDFDYGLLTTSVLSTLEKNHKDSSNKYAIINPNQFLEEFSQMVNSTTIFVALISGISLFVGLIGIMNTLYVSIWERRKEFAIRRALGATPSSIIIQCIIESLVISLLSGLIGIIVGIVFSNILNIFLPFKAQITFGNCFVNLGLATLIGILAGILPARKASKLNPIEGLYSL